ncbi:MAG: hypothetical protein MJZ25_00760 [Fibrobacter sp.]|nr:hypothetical protein [Fibrobacter sp.]
MGEVFCKKKNFWFRCSKCSRKFLGIAAVDQPVVAEDVAKVVKEDPRADRAKERFERKDAKKAIMADRDAAKAERKANRTKDI